MSPARSFIGWPRIAQARPNAVHVALAQGEVAGRVAMDQVVVDLGPDADPDELLGAEAVLFGPGDDGAPTADDWARASRTINYEIVTRISPRVPRVYVGEGA